MLIGVSIVAAAITRIISGAVLLALRKRFPWPKAQIIAHGITAIFSVLLAAWGDSNGGPMAWGSGLFYLLPVGMWLIIYLLIGLRRKHSAQ